MLAEAGAVGAAGGVGRGTDSSLSFEHARNIVVVIQGRYLHPLAALQLKGVDLSTTATLTFVSDCLSVSLTLAYPRSPRATRRRPSLEQATFCQLAKLNGVLGPMPKPSQSPSKNAAAVGQQATAPAWYSIFCNALTTD